MPVTPDSMARVREEYESVGIAPGDLHPDPIVQFEEWFDQAAQAGVRQPNAMAFATVDDSGMPRSRNVLLKSTSDLGFEFYTNLESAKAAEALATGQASLLFTWLDLHRQVRVEGSVAVVEAAESDAYFATRPRGAQIGAWASPQSETIEEGALERRVEALTERFGDGAIPRPAHWGGLRVSPTRVEFWQGRPNRLHDRVLYDGSPWTRRRLAP